MNVQPNLRMSKPEFLTWVQGQEGRFELVAGRVVMMTGGTRGHAIIMRRLAAALEKRLDGRRWTADFGVDLGADIVRYPDVVVDAAGQPLKDLTATAPLLIAEVLSPSSLRSDLGEKAAEYLRLPSLAAYLVLSQDEPKAWVWVRGNSGFSQAPQVLAGYDAQIEIAALAISVPLSEISAGLATS
jgi:Uma2 family endonuclease